MNTRKFIIATIVIPILLLALYFFIDRSGPGSSFPGKVSYSERVETIYSVDGTIIPVTITVPDSDRYSKMIILASDRGLDADWNSKGLISFTGEYLAHAFASNGIATIRYDQRGTGESKISGRNEPDPEYLAADLGSVLKWTRSAQVEQVPIYLLGHGEGCITALMSVERSDVQIDGVILSGCAYSGSLLENWGMRLINNMKRRKVDPKYISQASLDLKKWIHQKEGVQSQVNASNENTFSTPVNAGGTPEDSSAKKAMAPDLIAFYQALEYMESPEHKSYTNQSAKLIFKKLLQTVIEKQVRVYQFIGQMDDEIPDTEREENLNLKNRFPASFYRLTILPKTDHFYMERMEKSSSIITELLRQLSPMRNYSQNSVRLLLETIENDPGRVF